MYKLIPAFCALSLLCFSCKKKEIVTPKIPPMQDIVYPDYHHLKPGNYWIYQVFEVDTFGNEKALNLFDSVYAGAEMLIDGKTYRARLTAGNAGPEGYYIRDSLHYSVSPDGRITFSSLDFNSIFYSYYQVWTPIQDTMAFVT